MTDTLKTDTIVEPIDDSDDEPIFGYDDLLGKYISHHPVNRLRLIIQAGVIYFVITTALQILSLELDDQTASILLIFSFAAVALGLGWYVLHLWNREVVVYEHGFNYREGSAIADFQYKEVVSFRQKAQRLRYFGGLLRRNVYTFIVRTHRDEVIKVTNLYTDIEKLGHNLEVGINSILRQRVQEALINGESVSFGDSLEVTRSGINADGQDLSWDRLTGYGTRRGHLTLSATDNELWYEIPLEDVDNLTLLIEVLRQHLPSSATES